MDWAGRPSALSAWCDSGQRSVACDRDGWEIGASEY